MRVNPVTIVPNRIVVYVLGIKLLTQLPPLPEFYPAAEPVVVTAADDGYGLTTSAY